MAVSFVFLLLFIISVSSNHGSHAIPYPTKGRDRGRELGSLVDLRGKNPITATVMLRLRNPKGAEELLEDLHTQGHAHFGKFLTAADFEKRFAPQADTVAHVTERLHSLGLAVEKGTATTLRVKALPAIMEAAFGVSLRLYEVAEKGNSPAFHYIAPLTRPSIPEDLAAFVSSVVGLDTRPIHRPSSRKLPRTIQRAPPPPLNDTVVRSFSSYSPFGEWTVTDFARYYNVLPLYDRGIKGKGRTLGIVSFASITVSDVFSYWEAIGLKVHKHRLTVINIDGGPGKPSDESGSDETTLDIEQAGGVAPDADIILYQGPNSAQTFVNAFAQAVSDNAADSISVSWGSWEVNAAFSGTIDPFSGSSSDLLDSLHEVFLRAGIQGQSIIASAGDAGAFEANRYCTLPYNPDDLSSCSLALSVGYPASDPAVTAVGGTTLQSVLTLDDGEEILIPTERVWSWDYMASYCSAVRSLNEIDCGIFPVGGGGGVSLYFDRPSYQRGIHTTHPTEANQFYLDAFIGGKLAGNYSGRNVPDVSFNSDPLTGYVLFYTSKGVFHSTSGNGGTSYAAPQLNGVTALLSQYARSRIGLLNYHLYDLLRKGKAYDTEHSPLNRVREGGNWFYRGSPAYNPGAGVGTMNVANFAKYIKRIFHHSHQTGEMGEG